MLLLIREILTPQTYLHTYHFHCSLWPRFLYTKEYIWERPNIFKEAGYQSNWKANRKSKNYPTKDIFNECLYRNAY